MLRRASSRGARDVVSWCALARARWPRIAGRSRGLERQRHGRRSRHADLGGYRTEPRPAKPQRSGGFAIATSLGLWVRFSDWSDGGIGRPAIPTARREENAARGPESARSHIGRGVWPRSNAARRRAKGAQRWRMVGPTSASARRARYPRTRGRGRRPRTAGVRARRRRRARRREKTAGLSPPSG